MESESLFEPEQTPEARRPLPRWTFEEVPGRSGALGCRVRPRTATEEGAPSPRPWHPCRAGCRAPSDYDADPAAIGWGYNSRVPLLDADLEESIRIVRGWIDASSCITVLTGAGISTDSGIPDFRGPQGVWTKNPEAEKKSTIQHYLADPEARKRTWKTRMGSFNRRAEPNVGHHSLVELERREKLHLLITQNVDGLHHDAGSDPSLIVEIHGTVREVMCMQCSDRNPMQYALDRVDAGEEDPACEKCGGILKPATISFNQSLVARDLQRSEEAAQGCDMMLAIGTTLGVFPIAAVVPIAKQCGARVVILNAEPTEMDHIADAVLRGGIADILPLIVGGAHSSV